MRDCSAVLSAFLMLVFLAGCGEQSGTAPAGSTPSTPPPASSGAGSGAGTASKAAEERVGLLEELGASIYMEGTHKLSVDGKLICLLESNAVDLAGHVGTQVKVSGPSRATVEGNMTIMTVEKIAGVK